MLGSIVRATRTHYAMLQHRAGPGREPLTCRIDDKPSYVLWVHTDGIAARRKYHATRVHNLLRRMYPEARSVDVEFARAVRTTALEPGQESSP